MVMRVTRSFAIRVVAFAFLSVLFGWGIMNLSDGFIASRWIFDDSWVVKMLEVSEVPAEEAREITLFDEWRTEAWISRCCF